MDLIYLISHFLVSKMIISKIHLTCIRKASERQDPRTNNDTNSLVFTQGSLSKALQQK